jgi:seryl-tRNA synthetase
MTTGLLTTSEFRAELLDSGMLVDAGLPGLFHRSAEFESIIGGLQRLAQQAGQDLLPRQHHFAPMMPRADFVATDYLRSFPDLIGSIETFRGSDLDHAALLRDLAAGEDWTTALQPTDVVLCSAVCHSLYPQLRGQVLIDQPIHECHGYVFRHEPSLDPARLQSFRMHEFVYVGDAVGALNHRDEWLRRGLDLLSGLRLDVTAEVANDPFFGRTGQLLAQSQRGAALKYEITAPITAQTRTAISSANCHGDHFGANFQISQPDGTPAHTSCFGFGLERIALALLSAHGLQLSNWPATITTQLWAEPAPGGSR